MWAAHRGSWRVVGAQPMPDSVLLPFQRLRVTHPASTLSTIRPLGPGPVIKLPSAPATPPWTKGSANGAANSRSFTAARGPGRGLTCSQGSPHLPQLSALQRRTELPTPWALCSQEHKISVLDLACQDTPALVSEGRGDLGPEHVCTHSHVPGCLHTLTCIYVLSV